jgi:hypothetical protein
MDFGRIRKKLEEGLQGVGSFIGGLGRGIQQGIGQIGGAIGQGTQGIRNVLSQPVQQPRPFQQPQVSTFQQPTVQPTFDFKSTFKAPGAPQVSDLTNIKLNVPSLPTTPTKALETVKLEAPKAVVPPKPAQPSESPLKTFLKSNPYTAGPVFAYDTFNALMGKDYGLFKGPSYDVVESTAQKAPNFVNDIVRQSGTLGITQPAGEVTKAQVEADPERFRNFVPTTQTGPGSQFYAQKAKSTAQQAGDLANAALFYGTFGGSGLARLGATPLTRVGLAGLEEGTQNLVSGAALRYGETGDINRALDPKSLVADFGFGAGFAGVIRAPGAIKSSIQGKKVLNELIPVIEQQKTREGVLDAINKSNLAAAEKIRIKSQVDNFSNEVARTNQLPQLERLVYGNERLPQTARQLSVGQTISPDRLLRETITQPAEQAVNRAIARAQVSENVVARGIGRGFTGISTEAGRTPEALAQRKLFQGSEQYGKVLAKEVSNWDINLTPIERENVYSTFGKQAKSINTLSAAEKASREKLAPVLDWINETNYANGLINEGQYNAGKNGRYIKTTYDIFELADGDAKGVRKSAEAELKNALKKKGVIVDENLLNAEIKDANYAIAKRLSETVRADAMVKYSNWLNSNGLVSDVARPGMLQLPKNVLYGEAAGKFVPKTYAEDFKGFIYTNNVIGAIDDLFTRYDRLAPRQAKKAILTVFNPAVRLGNQVSNRVIFSNLSGINPVQFNAEYAQVNNMIKSKSPVYLEAVRRGLFGTDITNKELTMRLLNATGDDNIARRGATWVKKSYSEADDKAKLTAFSIWLKRGYSPEQAASMVQRGFQDYSSVGFFYDLAAKTPIIGNAFVRFAADSIRIAKNAAIDHPMRAIGTVAMWSLFTDGMSKLSGESEQDRQTRENRFGAPKIPFTNISLEVQTPWGAVNVARFMPYYELNSIGSPVTRFLPIQGNPLKPEGWNDPILGQLLQYAVDKDFRGRSIQDPNNVIIYENGNYKVTKYNELDPGSKVLNVMRSFATQNVPMGREIDSISSAILGGEDVYGKKRDVVQSLLRAAGVKVEQFGPEQAQRQRETTAYYEENVARTKDFLAKNPDLAPSYFEFSKPTVDRQSGKKISNIISPERWKVIAANRDGRLYNFLRDQAISDFTRDGKPIDPVFQLTPERAKLVTELRSRPTGDDIEMEEILRATTNWYTGFEKAEKNYYQDNNSYFKSKGLENNTENERARQYREVGYPEQSNLIKQYYQIKAQNPAVAKQFFKANADQLSNDFANYKQARLDSINAKRAIEGFPAIPERAFNNVTFGYEDDERKVFNELRYEFGQGARGRKSYTPRVNQPFIQTRAQKPGGLGRVPGVGPQVRMRPGQVVVRRTQA